MKLSTNVTYYSVDPPLHGVLLKAKSGEEITIWEYELRGEEYNIVQERYTENDMRTPNLERLKVFIQQQFMQFITEDSSEQELKFKIVKRE